MSTLAIDWGDIPTWVSAITTLGALIAAGWVVRIELKRDDRALTARASAEQADKVAAWPGGRRAGTYFIVLRNSSDLPIYDVAVFAARADSGGPPPMAIERLDLLPPGDREIPFFVTKEPRFTATRVGFDEPIVDDEQKWLVVLEFSDSAGRRWRRDNRGRLERKD